MTPPLPRLLAALAAPLLLAGAFANAAPVRTEHVEAELIAERAAAAPGKPATVGLRLRMDEHWHTYWKNPGDSGLPTKIQWKLPEGWTAGPIAWPHPEAQRVGPLMNYGYSDEAVLLSELTPPAGARPGPVTITGDASWLVCKDICIPEKATLALAFAVADGEPPADAAHASLFAKARARLPATLAGWTTQSAIAGNALSIRYMPPAGTVAPAKIAFFPYRENFVDHPAPQTLVRDGGGFRLEMKLAEPVAKDVREVAGVLVAESAWPGAGNRRSVEIAAPVVAAFPPAQPPIAPAGNEAGASLALALVFALAGGLLLNLMPCVFPVLGIKVMGFVRHAHGDARALCVQGAVFSAGVLLSFLVLAGLLLALRAGGTELGWGFQMQSPAFVTLLAALFLLMALNLFGVFEWGGIRAVDDLAAVTAEGRYADAFLAGVLATVVATPCTAPFMGAALGFTLSQPAACRWRYSRCWASAWRCRCWHFPSFPRRCKRLPKPGPWMETFKQVMAFPLFATVVWLAWVLGAQAATMRCCIAPGRLAGARDRRLDLRPLGMLGGQWRASSSPASSPPPGSGLPGPAPRPHPTRRTPRCPGPARSRGSRGRRKRSRSCARPARRCSSTSPPRGASPARSTSAWRSIATRW